jgi:glutathione S-transferase
MSVGLRIRLHRISPSLQADLTRLDALWTEGLHVHGGPWLVGRQFTAVDAFFAPVATRVQTYGLALSQPAAQYVQQMLHLPPVIEWMEAGIAEPWRDAGHEVDMLAHGEITQDLRAPQQKA